ncbi:MAG: YiiX/YebB-like N1pC/P60 family cysteine hydrolase [Gammaproteobacteria bacterium]|jgi:hypothetical protein|nr:YiiX/YebB-like N1pC/P60 family cysteine hydrolase [Gammaproteobacteria bacterium]MDP6733675.1 YiiX/YebB-like N1pC/P60 family cysteine hydrolase [Gammaproteobacteria bacterium]|tara:strand:- start:2161 stop:2928 length:768 start_codon:yes stop_codon:yes gene_type:complete
MITTINRAIGTRLATYLSKALPGYQRIDTVSIEKVASVLQTGDILLVEGNSRISTAIKYLTQSSWSHACLFVGQSGADCAESTLIEADLKHGVRLVSLQDYAGFNMRICRPGSLSDGDTQSLVEFAGSKLGHKYDLKNVVDLIRYLIQKPVVPVRYRRAMISFGSGEPTMAICSTLIAESFQSIDYPILPRRKGEQGRDGEVPQFYRRHFTHFTPRDFDLSPYFKVIKPTLDEDFDYRDPQWQGSGETEKENEPQ